LTNNFEVQGMPMSSFSKIVPVRNPILWKGVGLGLGACIVVLAIAIPNLLRSGMSAHKIIDRFESSHAILASLESVEADGPKVIRKAQLDLQVGNCAETEKKIDAIAAAESGFIESSTLEENSGKMVLRIPSARLDPVRGKLRELAIHVKQDSLTAADVSKQYFDGEARLRICARKSNSFWR
jgi:hypothetical protein